MTTRQQARREIEEDLIKHPDTGYAIRIKQIGVELETDSTLLASAYTSLQEINLTRYPKDAELKEAVRKARNALSEAYDLILDKTWRQMP